MKKPKTMSDFKKEVIKFSLLLFVISFSIRSTAQLPDLRLENLTNLSRTGDLGAVVEFNFDLINSGIATAEGDYTIAMYLSDDNSFGDEDDIKVGEIITGNTAIGTIPNVLGAITVPNNINPSDYILYIKVDDGNVMTETREDNNILQKNIFVNPTELDCFPPSITPPEFTCVGDFSKQLKMEWSKRESAYAYHVLLIKKATNELIDEQFLDWNTYASPNYNFYNATNFEVETEYEFRIAAVCKEGRTDFAILNFTTPSATYDVTAVMFLASEHFNAIQYGRLTSRMYFQNYGATDTNADVDYYISKDEVISDDDLFLTREQYFFSGCKTDTPGDGTEYSTTKITELPDGDYYLIAKLDPDNKITELDETNNVSTMPFPINFKKELLFLTTDNKVVTEPFIVYANFKDEVTGFDLADVDVTNGTKSDFIQQSASEYNFTITPSSSGLVNISVAGNVATNSNGTGNFPDGLKVYYETDATGKVDLELTGTEEDAYINGLEDGPLFYTGFSIEFTLTNKGERTSRSAQVKISTPSGVQLRGSNPDNTISTIIGNDLIWEVKELAPNESAYIRVYYFNATSLRKSIFGQVIDQSHPDLDSSPNNGIPPITHEDDEYVISINKDGEMLPDLQFHHSNKLPTTALQGEQVDFILTFVNSGELDLSGDYHISMVLSTDENFGNGDDIAIGRLDTFYPLKGTYRRKSVRISIPEEQANGDYFLIVKIDPNNDITECDEDNNLLIGNIQITSPSYENGCSFLTRDTANQIASSNLKAAIERKLSESNTGYNLTFYSEETNTIGTYELTKEGEVINFYEEVLTKDYEVIIEKDVDNNIEMVFLKSPNLTAGTRVPIDINYDGNPTVVYAFKAFKTSMGFAFCVSLLDPDDPDHYFYDRIFQTNNIGEIQMITAIPVGVDQPFNFHRLLEGVDGSLYLSWEASGKNALFGVPANGAPAWHASVAVDTPSATWVDTKVSLDGQFVYTAKTDNQRAYISKYNAIDGTPLGIDLSEITTSPESDAFRKSWVGTIAPTPDGGLLVDIAVNDIGSESSPSKIFAKYDATGNIIWKKEIYTPNELQSIGRPIGGTSDGGAIFIGVDIKGTFADKDDDDFLFLKLTATGALLPTCIPIVIDSLDLALESLELLTTPTTVGQEIRLGFEIVNLGQAMITDETISAKLFLSTDQNYSGDDIFIVENNFGLGNVIIEGTIPNDTPEGTYYALIVLDDNNSIVESDETNNVKSTATNFTIGMVNSISELAIENFKIYPTITNNKITILLSSKKTTDLVLNIYNINGQEVMQKQIKITSGINQFQLDASEFASGMYHVILLPENGQALTRKFIKQ